MKKHDDRSIAQAKKARSNGGRTRSIRAWTSAALILLVACGSRIPNLQNAPGLAKIVPALDKQSQAGDKLADAGTYVEPILTYAEPQTVANLENADGRLSAGANVWLAAAVSNPPQVFKQHPFTAVVSNASEPAYCLANLTIGSSVEPLAVPYGDFESTPTTFFEPAYVYHPEQQPDYKRWCGFGEYELSSKAAASGGLGLLVRTKWYTNDEGTSAPLFSHVMSPPFPCPEKALVLITVKYQGPRHRDVPGDRVLNLRCLVRKGDGLVKDYDPPALSIYSKPATAGQWELHSTLFEVPEGTESVMIGLRSAGSIGATCMFDDVRMLRVP